VIDEQQGRPKASRMCRMVCKAVRISVELRPVSGSSRQSIKGARQRDRDAEDALAPVRQPPGDLAEDVAQARSSAVS